MNDKKKKILKSIILTILLEVIVYFLFKLLFNYLGLNTNTERGLIIELLYFTLSGYIVYSFLPEGTLKKHIEKIGIFILLLLGMASFPSIPIALFNINTDTWSTTFKIIYEFIFDLLFMLIVYLSYRKKINKEFKDYFSNFIDNIELTLKYYIVGLIIMIVSNLIINLFFTGGIAGNEEKVRSLLTNYPLYMIFSISIYAPFIEEMIFRRSIKDTFIKETKYTKYLYILTSGLIFGGMHLLEATKAIEILYIIPYGALGIAFAANYYKTNNIFSTITIHCIHNTVTVILFFLTGGIK